MLVKSILVFYFCTRLCHGSEEVRYDFFTGVPTTEEQEKYYESVGKLSTCTLNVALPCDPNEWRRVDGSCNNLKKVAGGTFFNPMYRLLPPDFHEVYHSRKAESGEELPLPRTVRNYCLKTGKSKHREFNMNVPGFGIFMFGDIGSVHDIENTLIRYPYCCEPEHINDYACASNFLEADDPVHRFDGIRCMNMSRPAYHQDYLCTNETVPSPIAQATFAFDMSHIYNQLNQGVEVLRQYSGGLLIVEEDGGISWPPNGPTAACLLNEADETKCFKYHRNALLPVQLFTIWFYNYHNHIAKNLAKVNPSWDDETLFQTAKDINTANMLQIYYYEWLVALMGRENLIKSGVITKDMGFRCLYDDKLFPQVSLEYTFLLRWFHIIQETRAEMYDLEGNFVKYFPLVNNTFRTGNLEKGNNMAFMTQGCMLQATRDYDGSVDYDIAEQGLAGLQRAMDITTSDVHKNRLFGLAPYIDYVKKFFGHKINTFKDLVTYKLMSPESVRIMKMTYKHVRDIDLIVGTWHGTVIKGGNIPAMLAYVLQENMLRAVKSDRFWYECDERAHAFTANQLFEIRKSTLAMLMCSVANNVTRVQPDAFRIVSPKNPLTPCSEIPNIDWNAWKVPDSTDDLNDVSC